LAEAQFPVARGGIADGPVEERGGDYYGPAVNPPVRPGTPSTHSDLLRCATSPAR